jgi:hypothetical protein
LRDDGTGAWWQRHRYRISLAIALTVIAVGVARAYGLRWYCDDTFITLRYASNFLSGHGFVYNPGEYVEGYTHFLWLLLLTFSGLLGFDTLGAATFLGLLSYAGVVTIFCVISYRLNRNRLAVVVPFTALALALNSDFTIWATGGLETMLLTFLLSAAFYVQFFSALPRSRRLFGVGSILVLAALTRPDAALLFVLADLLLLALPAIMRRPARETATGLAAFNAPFFLLCLPYLLWKYMYYGDLLPNTFYAKSAGASYYSRGLFYLWLYLKAHFTSALMLLAVPVVAIRLRAAASGAERWIDGVRDALGDARLASVAFVLVAVPVYLLLFVARVGGDFMYARFVIPVVPFMMFAVETAVVDSSRRHRVIPLVAFAILGVSIGTVENGMRDRMLQRVENGSPKYVSHKGIIDEHYLRTVVDDIRKDRAFGEFLRPYFKGLHATVLLKGRACIGYYAGFETCIENFGLTDKYIAHLPIEGRSRPGHEREAPHKYLVERGVDFIFDGKTLFFGRARQQEFAWFNLPDGRVVRVQLVTYDRELMHALAARMGPAFEYTDFEKYLDLYIARELPKKGGVELLGDYTLFRDYYFLHNDDPRRERPFLEKLGGLTGVKIGRKS